MSRTTRVAAAVLAAGALAVPTATAAQADIPLERQITEIAHRGSSFEQPENTLAAVREGICDKADMVEIDVQRSKDGVLVVIHDTNLRRTTNVEEVFPDRLSYEVKDFTYAELQQLDAGSWKGEQFAGERIPTFKEVIDTVRRSGSGLLVEVKAPALYPGIAQQVADEIAAEPGYLKSAVANERLVVQSFDWAFMKEYNSIQPQVPAGLLGRPAEALLPELATWADQINPAHKSVDAAYIAKVHEAGMVSNVWTVDAPADMQRAIDMGVDGIITNKPDLLDAVLRAR
ncbi:glycerophosphodiester phosphodiesterase [Actinomycetota bacterium]